MKLKKIMMFTSLLSGIGLNLYAPVDPQTDQGCRQILFNMGTVVDGVESMVDDLVEQAELTFSFLENIDSKVDVIDSRVDDILVEVAQIDTNLSAVDSKIDQIDSKLDECCATLIGKLDGLSLDFQETWTILGSNGDASVDPASFATAQDLDDAQVSIVTLIKTIMRELFVVT